MDNDDNEEEERFEDIPDAAMPIDLPPCELNRLFEIREVIEGAMSSPIRRERLAVALQSENYIPVRREEHVCTYIACMYVMYIHREDNGALPNCNKL